MEIPRQTDILEKSLGRMLHWIKAIDTKTQLALGINVGMLGAILALTPRRQDMVAASLGLLALGGLLPFLSCIQCLRAFFPRTTGPGDSRIFFGAIDNRTLQGFREALERETEETYCGDLTEQVYRNAQIANAKYNLVKSAIVMQGLAVTPWLVACYLLYRGT